ncbi:putative transcription factor GRAS family [Helianthus annuus]|nr:putative transcription factor GRAS family [Helianthus annuus]
MRELGLYDYSNTNSNSNTNNSNNNSNRSSGYPLDLPDLPSFFYSDFDQNLNQNLFDLNNLMSEEDATHTNEFDYRIELTRLAECFETQSFQLAQVIHSRLNQRLRSPTGKPLQRAAFYFKEAIQNLFNGSTSTTRSLQSCTSYEIVQVIKAYRTFSTVSPIRCSLALLQIKRSLMRLTVKPPFFSRRDFPANWIWFVNDLRRVSPTVVVYVDGELNGSGASFFSKAVIDGVELYTTVLESLEAANVAGGAGGDWIKSIEMFVLLPKIIAAVEDGGRNVSPWREAFGRAGLRPVAMSQFGEFQAECLVRRVQVRGFHVVKQHAEMMLCWHDRPLVATSVWSF